MIFKKILCSSAQSFWNQIAIGWIRSYNKKEATNGFEAIDRGDAHHR